jgi:hypothetical protein
MKHEVPPINNASGKLVKSVLYKENGVEETFLEEQIIGL